MQVFQYLSVLCGMVGSMDTMAPDESSRDRLEFLREDKNTLLLGVTCKENNNIFSGLVLALLMKRAEYTFRRTQRSGSNFPSVQNIQMMSRTHLIFLEGVIMPLLQ